MDIVIGVIIGAAFAPFWMSLWSAAKAMFLNITSKKS